MTPSQQYDDARGHNIGVVRVGRQRFRDGQANRKAIAIEGIRERPRAVAVSANTRAVQDLVDHMEAAKWANADDPSQWQRLDAIQREAQQQIADDTGNDTLFSRGGRRPERLYQLTGDEEWVPPPWSPENEALAEGFRPFLDQLTAIQRDTVTRLYWLRQSEREAARELKVIQQTVDVNKRRALNNLRTALTTRYKP
jgi:DNA-directed RNA polymerase specialized sigma24 family protein